MLVPVIVNTGCSETQQNGPSKYISNIFEAVAKVETQSVGGGSLLATQVSASFEADAIVIPDVPIGTAASVLLAALSRKDHPEEIIFIVPSDIAPMSKPRLEQALVLGRQAAQQGDVVAFGDALRQADVMSEVLKVSPRDRKGVLHAAACLSGPIRSRTADMLAASESLRSSGMFMIRVKELVSLYQDFAPDLYAACTRSMEKGAFVDGALVPEAAALRGCQSRGFEEVIMSRLSAFRVVPLNTPPPRSQMRKLGAAGHRMGGRFQNIAALKQT